MGFRVRGVELLNIHAISQGKLGVWGQWGLRLYGFGGSGIEQMRRSCGISQHSGPFLQTCTRKIRRPQKRGHHLVVEASNHDNAVGVRVTCSREGHAIEA